MIDEYRGGEDGRRYASEAWTLICQMTPLLVPDCTIRDISWGQRGDAEALLISWYLLTQKLTFDLSKLWLKVECGTQSSADALDEARKLVRDYLAEVRPNARVRPRLFRVGQLASTVEFIQLRVVTSRLEDGLGQIVAQHRGECA